MIKSISEKKKTPLIEIDLTGPQGNAFYLLGAAKNLTRQLAVQSDTWVWEDIEKEMQAGDYEHLVQTFDKIFGSFVTLYR